jgi:hypothetical protein
MIAAVLLSIKLSICSMSASQDLAGYHAAKGRPETDKRKAIHEPAIDSFWFQSRARLSRFHKERTLDLELRCFVQDLPVLQFKRS